MRFFAGLGLLIVASFVPQAGFAAGNVLLPESSSGSSSSFPNLGLLPRLFAPAPKTTPSSSSTPSAATPTAPTAEKPASVVQPVVNIDTRRPQAFPRDFRPTIVAPMPLPTRPQRAPRVFTFALTDRSVFSANDVAKVSKTLGISPDQVAATCSLSLRGTLVTTQANTFIDGGISPQALVGYSGVIVDRNLRAVAVCPANHPLPQGVGIVVQTAGSYIVQLEDLRCDETIPPGAAMLLAKYTGAKTTECIVQ